MKSIKVIRKDITQVEVDVIVNDTNNALRPSSPLDKAIHQAAGPELLSFCKNLFGCDTGQAVLTPGFQLPAPYLIHTVGPVWQGGTHHEEIHLRNCFKESLKLARALGLASIAFPAIGCGSKGLSHSKVAEWSVETIHDYLEKHMDWDAEIYLCAHSGKMEEQWESAIELFFTSTIAAV